MGVYYYMAIASPKEASEYEAFLEHYRTHLPLFSRSMTGCPECRPFEPTFSYDEQCPRVGLGRLWDRIDCGIHVVDDVFRRRVIKLMYEDGDQDEPRWSTPESGPSKDDAADVRLPSDPVLRRAYEAYMRDRAKPGIDVTLIRRLTGQAGPEHPRVEPQPEFHIVRDARKVVAFVTDHVGETVAVYHDNLF